MLFLLLKNPVVALKLQNFAIFTTRIVHLDHRIQSCRLETSNHTTNSVRTLKTSTKVAELQPFLGLCKQFKRFVSKFARILQPLSIRLKKMQAKYLEPLEEDVLRLPMFQKKGLYHHRYSPCHSTTDKTP